MEIINTRSILGLVLIILGLFIFLANMGIITADFTLFIIAGGFYAAYFVSGKKTAQRRVGFLVPALLITAVALFDILDNYVISEVSGSLFFLLIALSFLFLYLLHTVHLDNYKNKEWPLYAAGCIFAFSLFVYIVEAVDSAQVQLIVIKYWPILIILSGVILFFKGFRSKEVDRSTNNNDESVNK